MPLHHHVYPFAEVGAQFAEANKGVELLNWRFTGEELRRLHASISSSGQRALTIQDCLSAYIVTVLNRCREKPIRMVTNQANYRRVKAPFVEENMAGNAIQTIITEQLPLDMVGIATAIRTSIIRSRDPQDLENWLSTATDLMLTTANSGKSFFFKPYDDVVDVNGTSS
ncbi:hypothetical protein SCLCIDRAFT_127632 [Scleroderma citrinum Foug A]|uniref:Uncharacterized protein n=1 Tax=Scleroderma citrinum Foug A TaxID=1036808 RepID=A0A0C3DR95_9AGAM|nr:hypothetical protein SCLCIDRAFT_127632 [Scleroderma citrinum Foug A]